MDSDTVIHELGHYLEDNNSFVHQEAVDFYNRRTAGDQLESLRSLTGRPYRSSERTRKDNWFDPYVGKEYLDASGNRKYTEIISMGMQYIWKDPASFAAKDPEYFDFIMNVLRGLPSK